MSLGIEREPLQQVEHSRLCSISGDDTELRSKDAVLAVPALLQVGDLKNATQYIRPPTTYATTDKLHPNPHAPPHFFPTSGCSPMLLLPGLGPPSAVARSTDPYFTNSVPPTVDPCQSLSLTWEGGSRPYYIELKIREYHSPAIHLAVHVLNNTQLVNQLVKGLKWANTRGVLTQLGQVKTIANNIAGNAFESVIERHFAGQTLYSGEKRDVPVSWQVGNHWFAYLAVDEFEPIAAPGFLFVALSLSLPPASHPRQCFRPLTSIMITYAAEAQTKSLAHLNG
ncbi:hypothetical protein BDV98DRAFT_586720 [Pterulicium gracile]|uniref:Uncharacterized protein n=1 Tax=Pterulicium gracile TaxID=1884261 RepID=A0A5C3Q2D7_9AGAR|nr:hypothetical protein BDV98DRAFT_586720 [Pterula gracilis]